MTTQNLLNLFEYSKKGGTITPSLTTFNHLKANTMTIHATTKNALTAALTSLTPTYLDLQNESHNHAGYFDGKESHFKLTIVSSQFEGLRQVARHQKVYALVQSFLMVSGGTVHALAIHAYTPDEWANIGTSPDSPNCAGQNK